MYYVRLITLFWFTQFLCALGFSLQVVPNWHQKCQVLVGGFLINCIRNNKNPHEVGEADEVVEFGREGCGFESSRCRLTSPLGRGPLPGNDVRCYLTNERIKEKVYHLFSRWYPDVREPFPNMARFPHTKWKRMNVWSFALFLPMLYSFNPVRFREPLWSGKDFLVGIKNACSTVWCTVLFS